MPTQSDSTAASGTSAPGLSADTRRGLWGASAGIVLTGTQVAVNLVHLRLVVSYLPVHDAGIWLLFLTMGAYLTYFDLGLSPTLSREIGFALGRTGLPEAERQGRIAELLATCRLLFAVLALGILALGGVAGLAFLSQIVQPARLDEIGQAWAIFTAASALFVWNGSLMATLYGLGRVATERGIRSTSLVVRLGLIVAVLAAGYGIRGLALVWLLQHALIRLLAWAALRRSGALASLPRRRARREVFRALAGPSLRFAATTAGTVLVLHTDTVMIAWFLDPAQIPGYEAILRIVLTLYLLTLHVATASSPFIAKAHTAGAREAMAGFLLRDVRLATMLIAAAIGFLALNGREVVDVWLGPGFYVGDRVLWTLLAVSLLEVHQTVLMTAAMATGRVVFVATTLGAGVLNLALSIALVNTLGLWGLALATLIAHLLTNAWYAPWVALRAFGLPLPTYAVRFALPLGITFAALFAANSALRAWVLPGAPVAGLAVRFALASALAMVLFYGIVLTPPERAKLRGILRHRGRP